MIARRTTGIKGKYLQNASYRKRTLAAALLTAIVVFSPSHGRAASSAALDRLTLQAAESLFAERNRDLLAARRIVEGAEADVISAAAPPNPSLSIGTSRISPSLGIGAGRLTDKRVDTVIGLSQVFERGNKRELRSEAAQFNVAAARRDEADAGRQLLYQVQAAYYDLLLAQEKLAIASTTATLFDKSVTASELRVRAGDMAPTELARIRVDALRARNDASAARAEQQRSQLALGYLIGAEREADRIVATDSWPSDAVPRSSINFADILDQRADIQAAQARIKAAEKARDLARALRTRDITGGIQYERFPGDTANNSYGFTVSIPLFTRYEYAGEIRRADIELQAAQENLERSRAIAATEINRSERELTAAADRMRRSLDTLLPAASKAADGAEFAYTRGAIGIMDLLDARRQLYAAKLDTAAATADYAKALAAWRSATKISRE